MESKQIKYLGIDAGGTFTDFVLHEPNNPLVTHKVLSTPDNPALAILQGVAELGLNDAAKAGLLKIVHGSTVATNAALEGKGVKTAFVTNTGFADMLTIGRQARRELYNLTPMPIEPPVPRELCFEVDCRRDAKGNLIKELSDTAIDSLVEQIKNSGAKAVAINLLFSFLDSTEEKRIEQAMPDSIFVSRSSFVLPVYKEYERGMATWLNASLGPKVEHYMSHLKTKLPNCEIDIMQSSGGLMAVDEASKRAVNLLLSGPAGGLAAVNALGQAIGNQKILSFDMGGTSTDVSLMDGGFHLSDESRIGHWPVAVPMLDMATIGAGGGSISWIDDAGMLHVGPQSASSRPGPACYGNGGTDATVTDANLVLGHLPQSAKLGGSLNLDLEAANNAVAGLAGKLGLTINDTAEGIVRVAEQQMVAALHNVSVKQGHSPEDFTLCCFGGAGGLHVCSLAEQLNMSSAIIPNNAGVLSALGMLFAPRMKSATRSLICLLDSVRKDTLEDAYSQMLLELESGTDNAQCSEKRQIERSMDLRYQGQSYTIEVPYTENSAEEFIQQHKQRYGHSLNKSVELVNLKLKLIGDASLSQPASVQYEGRGEGTSENGVRIFQRDQLGTRQEITGPAIVCEKVSTTWLPNNWACTVDDFGNLLLKKR